MSKGGKKSPKLNTKYSSQSSNNFKTVDEFYSVFLKAACTIPYTYIMNKFKRPGYSMRRKKNLQGVNRKKDEM